LRQADPYAEHLPPVLLIAGSVAPHERARIAATLSQGQRLDIHGVLLGDWPAGNTVIVADDGTTTRAAEDATQHGSHPADVGRLTVLSPQEAADLITALAESHTGLPQQRTPQAATVTDAVGDASADAEHGSDAGDPAALAAAGGVADALTPPGDATQTGGSADPAERGAGTLDGLAEDAQTSDGTATEAAKVATVEVLGGARIVGLDPGQPLRAKSLELLVYLAARGGAATHEAILDDLIPEAPASKAPHRMHTYVYALRKALRHTTGGTDSFINHTPQQYTLTRTAFDIDLWRMRQALKEAAHATDLPTRRAALRRAVEGYRGPLAEGFDYEWIDAYREAVRREALDAHLALADALDGHPTEQLTVLQAAMHHDPYAEPAYQMAMRAHAELGNLDAVRALRRTLTRRLEEIDAEPDEDTLALADSLVATLQRRPRRTGPRPVANSGDGAAA
jgi:DNA-binding SARP family transcriptional activator